MNCVARGTGYYIREDSSAVYCGRRDSIVMSTAHPGHEDGTTRRRVKNASGNQMID